MDKQSIFRRESLDRVESPEQLDAYIKVSHPKVWLIMAAKTGDLNIFLERVNILMYL